MSNYIYTCACCGTQWDRTSTGRKPTKLELASMVCQPCREAPKRIAALENMLNFDKLSWAFHEPSYAALCLSEQQISLGKFCEYIRNLRDGKDDRIIQGVMPSDTDRIAELEAEAQRWREAHDAILSASADRANECDANLREAREEMEALRAENAALREDKARLVEAVERFERRVEEALRKGTR